MNRILLVFFLAAAPLVSSCVRYYRPDVQQGNVISQAMVDQLEQGMSKRQVLNILGTPLVVDPFHSDRWDYLFTFRKGSKTTIQDQSQLTVFFENEQLTLIHHGGPTNSGISPGSEAQTTAIQPDESIVVKADSEQLKAPGAPKKKGLLGRTWDKLRGR